MRELSGLPSDTVRDVGVQILLNDVPVHFGRRAPLDWDRKPHSIATTGYKQGTYCLSSSCGEDMDGAEWTNGGASVGSNDDIRSDVTFKYYQTTNAKPKPQIFHVGFTITLELQ